MVGRNEMSRPMMSVARSSLAECRRIATAQRDVITKAQALRAGLSHSAVQRLVRSETWLRERPSIYSISTPSAPGERLLQRLVAGALWLGDPSAASHRAGALVWELDGLDAAPLEFSTAGRRGGSGPGLIIHRVRSLQQHHIVAHRSVPVLRVPGVILGLAAVVKPHTLELCFASALRKRLTTVDEVVEELEQASPTLKGRAGLRLLLEGGSGARTESVLEDLVWGIFRRYGLPLPIRQHNVLDSEGRFVARVDFAYPDSKLAIEADGHRFHSTPLALQRDLARQNALIRIGWLVYRVTWEDATQRGRDVATDIAGLLAARTTQA